MYGDVWRKEKLVNCPNLELDNIVYAKEGDVQWDILLVSISGQSYVCQENITTYTPKPWVQFTLVGQVNMPHWPLY